jgi:hypothetical protein
MNELKEKMIRNARRRFSSIYPCAYKKDLAECFTTDDDYLMFWFNTEDDSTHIEKVKIA